MGQPNYPGLVYGVTQEEFDRLGSVESLFRRGLGGSEINCIGFEFRYNPERNAVGIYFAEEGEDGKLVLFESDLPENVRAFHQQIKESLERKLDESRIRKESWEE